MKIIKWLLKPRLKHSANHTLSNRGFTLIELMVGLAMAALIITPLLGLAVHLLETDRREQARTAAEEELQTALEYISRDLEQAVYIYGQTDADDSNGIEAIKEELPGFNDDTRIPILVFWKRKLIKDSLPFNTDVEDRDCVNANADNCDDAYVYSLVAYYTLEGDQGSSSIWSGANRIGRFEIQDGVRRLDGDYVRENDSRIGRDDGFAAFDLSGGGNLRQKMHAWERRANENYTNSIVTLVDYIDQTTEEVSIEGCPDDSDPNDPAGEPEWQRIPHEDEVATPGFYVCVFSSQNKARVFLRGNALARLRKDVPEFKDGNRAFFPQATIEVQGSGAITDD